KVPPTKQPQPAARRGGRLPADFAGAAGVPAATCHLCSRHLCRADTVTNRGKNLASARAFPHARRYPGHADLSSGIPVAQSAVQTGGLGRHAAHPGCPGIALVLRTANAAPVWRGDVLKPRIYATATP